MRPTSEFCRRKTGMRCLAVSRSRLPDGAYRPESVSHASPLKGLHPAGNNASSKLRAPMPPPLSTSPVHIGFFGAQAVVQQPDALSKLVEHTNGLQGRHVHRRSYGSQVCASRGPELVA